MRALIEASLFERSIGTDPANLPKQNKYGNCQSSSRLKMNVGVRGASAPTTKESSQRERKGREPDENGCGEIRHHCHEKGKSQSYEE